jgi:DNA (cytosine-5)-methyltransferase 1
VREYGHTFDFIHASPPCQHYTRIAQRNVRAVARKWPDMIAATRDALQETGRPYVIENVVEARPLMRDAITLCGSSFGLDVRRHRLFESNLLLSPLPCDHSWQTPRFRSLDGRRSQLASVVGVHGHTNYKGELELRRKAMGIDWMNNVELVQAIPPAYTEYIGEQLLWQLESVA